MLGIYEAAALIGKIFLARENSETFFPFARVFPMRLVEENFQVHV